MDTIFRKKVRHSVKRLKSLIKINEIDSSKLERNLKNIYESIETNQEQIDKCKDVKTVKHLHEVDVFYRETKDICEETIRNIQYNSESLETISKTLNEISFYDEDEGKIPEEENEIESIEQDAQRKFDEGNTFENVKKYDEALESYTQAVKLSPTNAHYWSRKGFCENELGNSDEALKSYTESTKYNFENGDYWHFRGFTELKLNRDLKALESYTQAVKFESRSSYFWGVKASIEKNLERYSEALESISQSLELELEPISNQGWRIKAEIEINLQKYVDAFESYNKALDAAQKEIDGNPHPNYKTQLEYSMVKIKEDKKNLQNFMDQSKTNPQNAHKSYEPEFDRVWSTKQTESRELASDKIKEKSLKEDLEREFAEEWIETFEEET